MSTGVGRGETLLVDIIALQRSFPTFPVKVILTQPEEMAPPESTEIVIKGNEGDEEAENSG